MIYYHCHGPHQANPVRREVDTMSLIDFMVSLLISILGSILGTLILQMLAQ